MKPAWLSILAAAALISLGACGSSSSPSGGSGGSASNASSSSSSGGSASSAKPKTACKVLTLALAKKTIGASAKRTRKAQPNPHESQCIYTSSTAFVSVLAGDWSFMHQFNTGGPQSKPVTGLGAGSTVSPSGLLAHKGNQGIDLDVGIAGTFTGAAATSVNARQVKLEKKLAHQIFARL